LEVTDIVDTRRPQRYDTTGDAVNDTIFFKTRRNRVTGREEIGSKLADDTPLNVSIQTSVDVSTQAG
jgi:hypothetical protein